MTFSSAFVRSVVEPGDYHDSQGLYLRVEAGGGKHWFFRYMLDGQRRKMGLGPADAIDLATARKLRKHARELAKQGIDPISARDQSREDKRKADARQMTLVQAYDGWKSLREMTWAPRTAYREASLWKMYGPQIGRRLLSELGDGELIVQTFIPLCTRYKNSANKALIQLRSIFEWAGDNNVYTERNPINLKANSVFLRRLPAMDYEVATRRAMPWQDIPAFIKRLRAARGNCGKHALNERSLISELLEFQILTGARPAQARLAKWDEFDLDNQTWTVPLHTDVNGKRFYRRKRSKNRANSVKFYINRPAIILLRTIKARQEQDVGGLRPFVFSHGPSKVADPNYYYPSATFFRQKTSKHGDSELRHGGGPLTQQAPTEYIRVTLGVKNYDQHGFRGTFKQWSIANGYSDLAAEAILDHQVGNAVRNTYAGSAQPHLEIIEMMDHWGRHCDGKKPMGAVIQGSFQRRSSHGS